MKNTIYFLLALSALSCSKTPEPTPEPDPLPTLSVTPATISLGGIKGSIDSIQIVHSAGWTITLDPSSTTWLKLSATSGTGSAKIYITAEEDNTTSAVRNASVIVKSANTQVTQQLVNVAQKVAELNGFHALFGGAAGDVFNDMVVTDDGYVAIGTTISTNGDVAVAKGSEDLWVLKTDKLGRKVWANSFGGTDVDNGYAITKTNDGGFILLGRTSSSNGDVKVNKGLSDIWVVKINSNGALVWEKTYGGSRSDQGNDIIPVKGGGYIIAAVTESNNGDVTGVDPTLYTSLNFMLRIDEAGNIIWAKTLGGTSQERVNAVAETNDGGFVGVGSLKTGFDRSDLQVFKVDGSGSLKWRRTYGDVFISAVGNNIVSTGNGSFWITGSRFSGYPVTEVDGIGGQDALVAAVADDGVLLWYKILGTTGEDELRGLAMTGNDIVAVGYTVPLGSSTSRENGWMVKMNGTGGIIWQKELGGTARDRINAVYRDPLGFLTAVGISFSNDGDVSGSKGLYDAWLFAIKE